MNIVQNHNLLDSDFYNVCGLIGDIIVGKASLSKTNVFSIHVDESYRGRGYSKILFQYALDYIDTMDESATIKANPELPTWFLERFGFDCGQRSLTYGEICLRHRHSRDFSPSMDVGYFVFLMKAAVTEDQQQRIKRKINRIKRDLYYEELKTRAFLKTHLGFGDHVGTTGMARHISTLYDTVTIACLKKNLRNIEQIYCDDPTIKFFAVEKYSEIDVNLGCDKHIFDSITRGFDRVYIAQFTGYETFPLGFYTSLCLDESLFWTHNYLPENKEACDVYSMLLDDLKTLRLTQYSVITNRYSVGILCSVGQIQRHLINKEALVLNLDGDIPYEPGHPYYNISKKYNMLPIYAMKHILENADELILADSSIFSFAIHLNIKTALFQYIPRGNEYVYLFSKKCVEKGTNPCVLRIGIQ
jgi:hypothetical protein